MKIAIPVLEDNNENSLISEHFGHAPYFCFIDYDEISKNYKIIEIEKNPFEEHGPGEIPQYLNNKKVNLLIVRGIGFKAIQFFNSYNISVIRGAEGTVKQIMQQLAYQKLFDKEYEVKEKFHKH